MSRTAYVMRGEQEAAPSPNHSLSTVDPTVSGLKAHPAPTHTHTHTHTHSLHTTSLIMSAGTPQSQSGVCSAAGCTHTHTHKHTHRLTCSYLPQPSRRAAALIITQDTMRKQPGSQAGMWKSALPAHCTLFGVLSSLCCGRAGAHSCCYCCRRASKDPGKCSAQRFSWRGRERKKEGRKEGRKGKFQTFFAEKAGNTCKLGTI